MGRKSHNIIKNVDILDLVEIKVIQIMPGDFQIMIDCLEKDKQLVFDPKALERLNNLATEKSKSLTSNHPNTIPFIKEFVGRMVSEMHKSGLCALDDVN